jgi:GGDEF domain-containing protein
VESAIRHVHETGEQAHYVEMDLRNLGGLNAALGHSAANEVYSAIAAIVRSELSAVSSESAFFRHGGDETCAILIDATNRAVRSAIKRTDLRVAKLAREYGVDDIPHPKHRNDPDRRGIGVVFGLVRLCGRHRFDPTIVFRQADREMQPGRWPRKRKSRSSGEQVVSTNGAISRKVGIAFRD